MSKRVFLVLPLVGLLLLTGGASKPSASSDRPRALEKLLEEKLAVLKEIDFLQKATGSVSAGSSYEMENEYLWSRRRLEVERALGEKKKDDQITALQGHADRMKRLEERVQQLAKTNAASKLDLLAAKFYRLEVDYWLEQAKAQ